MSDRDRLVDRGVISFEQAERFQGDATPDKAGGPRTVEVLAYIGAIGLFIATVALVVKVALPDDPLLGLLTDDFDNISGGLVALLGAALVFGTGYQFAGREGAVKRGSGFMLLAGWALASIGFGLLLFDLDIEDFTPIVVLIPSAAVATIAWMRLRSVPTQLALFAVAVNLLSATLILIQVEERIELSEILFTAALGGTPSFGSWISHAANLALGLAWIWMARTGAIRPRNTAMFIGSVYASIWAFVLYGTDDNWLILVGVLALSLLWAATQWGSSVLGAIGTIGLVLVIIQVMDLVYEEGPGTGEFILWFGIAGGLAVVGMWLLARTGESGTPAAMAPEPAPMPTTTSTEI